MKTLTNYTEQSTTKLFKDQGAFFAFGNKQFDEQKKPNIKYVSMGAGMVCPKDNAKALIKGLKTITKDGIALDIKENGKEGIIRRELANYEAYLVCDITDTVKALKGYGFTEDEIKAIYNSTKDEYNDSH